MLVRRLNRDKLIGTAIHHVDIGKSWPNHVEQMLVEAGIRRTDIELRLKERGVVIAWMTMLGAIAALIPAASFFGGNSTYVSQFLGSTVAVWVYTVALVHLRRRRISIRPYRLSAAGIAFMMLVSLGVQVLLSGVVSILPQFLGLAPWTILIALIVQYKTFASAKVLKGITIS